MTPSFAWALEGLTDLKLLDLSPGSSGLVHRVLESARSCPDLEGELGVLLSQGGWRTALIACVALFGRPEPALLDLVWKALDRGSWVAPQMAVTLWMLDEHFTQRAQQRLLHGWEAPPELTLLPGAETVVHGPPLAAKSRVSLMTVLTHDQTGRNWLLTHLSKADVLQDLLVEDAWDGSERLVARWGQAIADCLERPGLSVADDCLLQLWPPSAPEWLLAGELETGFFEPLSRAGVHEIVWRSDSKGDLVVAEPLGRIRFERPYGALLRRKLRYRILGNRLFTSTGVWRVHQEQGNFKMSLSSEQASHLELSRARLEDSGASFLVYGTSDDASMTAGPASALLALAGEELQWELRCDLALGSRQVGRVISTGAYGLEARGVRRIYHIVALESNRGCSQPELLGQALAQLLRSGSDEAVIAVASMASGGGGLKPELVARILVGAARQFFREHPRSARRVIFCLPSERDYEAFSRALAE